VRAWLSLFIFSVFLCSEGSCAAVSLSLYFLCFCVRVWLAHFIFSVFLCSEGACVSLFIVYFLCFYVVSVRAWLSLFILLGDSMWGVCVCGSLVMFLLCFYVPASLVQYNTQVLGTVPRAYRVAQTWHTNSCSCANSDVAQLLRISTPSLSVCGSLSHTLTLSRGRSQTCHICQAYRMAQTHRMPYVYRSFSAKEPYN